MEATPENSSVGTVLDDAPAVDVQATESSDANVLVVPAVTSASESVIKSPDEVSLPVELSTVTDNKPGPAPAAAPTRSTDGVVIQQSHSDVEMGLCVHPVEDKDQIKTPMDAPAVDAVNVQATKSSDANVLVVPAVTSASESVIKSPDEVSLPVELSTATDNKPGPAPAAAPTRSTDGVVIQQSHSDVEMGLCVHPVEDNKALPDAGSDVGSCSAVSVSRERLGMKTGLSKRFGAYLSGESNSDFDRDDPEPVPFRLTSLRDLYRFKENTYLQVCFGIFLVIFQALCLLLIISTIQVEPPDIRMQVVGLPISLVLLFGTSWDEFQLQMGLMLLNIKHSNECHKLDKDKPMTLRERYLNFHVLQAIMANCEVAIVLFTLAASVLVTIQQRTVLDIALNCTALNIITQLDECMLVMFRMKIKIIQPQKIIEDMEEQAEIQFNRMGAYKFRVIVVTFYCTVYFFFALFNNNFYYSGKYPWEKGGWPV